MDIIEQIGEAGIASLAAAFYRRMREDDLVGKMYPPDDWEGAEERFRDFLIFRFGGSQKYIEERGHPRLRMRHLPFKIDSAARDRWMEIMTAALDEENVPSPARESLEEFFAQTADFMRNTPD
ncbi:MAG: globin [Verrucomicrobiales bacterium]|nr:globin [Verrucomicrobiales bacterium]